MKKPDFHQAEKPKRIYKPGVCIICGGPTSSRKTKYCGQRCRTPGKLKEVHCICGKLVQWKSDSEPKKYCGSECYNIDQRKRVTAFGVTKTAIQWAEELGTSVQTIFSRLDRGWSPEDAVSTKPRNKPQSWQRSR